MFTLALIISIGIPSWSTSATVSIHDRGIRVEDLLTSLNLTASPKLVSAAALRDEILLVEVNAVDRQELLDKVAFTLHAEWTKGKEQWTLVRSDKLRRELEHDEATAFADGLKPFWADLKISPGLPPADGLTKALAATFSNAWLMELPNGEPQRLYANEPTYRQTPFSPFAIKTLQMYKGREGEALQKQALANPEQAAYWNRLAENASASPLGKVVFNVRKQGLNINAGVRIFSQDGSSRGSGVFQTRSVPKVNGRLATPTAETIAFRAESAAWSRLNLIGAMTPNGITAPQVRDLLSAYEPLQFAAYDGIMAVGQGKDIVACIPEALGSVCDEFNTSWKVSAASFATLAEDKANCEFQQTGHWLLLRPRFPLDNEWARAKRLPLRSMISEALETGAFSYRNYAKSLYLSNTRPSSWAIQRATMALPAAKIFAPQYVALDGLGARFLGHSRTNNGADCKTQAV